MDRPKMPFIAPLKIWFKDELKEKMQYYLSEEKLKETGLFNVEPVVKINCKEYLEGKAGELSKNMEPAWCFNYGMKDG